MSRCKACDQILTDYEMKRKDPVDVNQFLDLCSTCSQYSNEAIFAGSGNTLEIAVDDLDTLLNLDYNT